MAIAGCIPSLHSLAKEDQLQTDDRLEGIWYSQAVGTHSPFDLSIDIKIEKDGDDSPEDIQGSIDSIAESLNTQSEGAQWMFERVGNITFSRNKGKTTVKISTGVPSLMPDWEIAEINPQNNYHLTYTSWEDQDTLIERMMIRLTSINDELFMDFSPSHIKNPVLKKNARFAANYILGHTFAKIAFEEDRLMIYPLDSEYIENLIKSKRIRLKHENINEQIVLTASTSELREFIAKYGDDPQLYIEPETLDINPT